MITLNRDLLDRAKELPYVPNGEGSADDEDGFEFLGAGCERTVWLGPDGQVYKCDGRYGGKQNRKEYSRYTQFANSRTFPDWIYLPETVYDDVTGINVTEYVEGESPEFCYWDDCRCESECIWDMCAAAFDYLGSVDGHPGNCRVIRGNATCSPIVVIIDFTR